MERGDEQAGKTSAGRGQKKSLLCYINFESSETICTRIYIAGGAAGDLARTPGSGRGGETGEEEIVGVSVRKQWSSIGCGRTRPRSVGNQGTVKFVAGSNTCQVLLRGEQPGAYTHQRVRGIITS